MQDSLNLQNEEQGNFIVTVKNPEKPSPPNMRISPSQEADYPGKLENAFQDRRFSELDPPKLLYIEGAEFILVAAYEDIRKELG